MHHRGRQSELRFSPRVEFVGREREFVSESSWTESSWTGTSCNGPKSKTGVRSRTKPFHPVSLHADGCRENIRKGSTRLTKPNRNAASPNPNSDRTARMLAARAGLRRKGPSYAIMIRK